MSEMKRADARRIYTCEHGFACELVAREDIGAGWVQPIPKDCRLCEASEGTPRDTKPLPYRRGRDAS